MHNDTHGTVSGAQHYKALMMILQAMSCLLCFFSNPYISIYMRSIQIGYIYIMVAEAMYAKW